MSKSNTQTNTKFNMSKKQKHLSKIIQSLTMVEETEKNMRKKYKDDNIILKVYDRNQFYRVAAATAANKAIGNCVNESYIHYIKMFHKGYTPKLYKAKIYNTMFKKWCFHQYLTIFINNVEYYEDYSNGLHSRRPLDVWKKMKKLKNVTEIKMRIIEID